MKTATKSFALMVLMLISITSFGQIGESSSNNYDKYIKAKLDELKITYEITSKGNFKIIFKVGNSNRTQALVINSKLYTYNDINVREIWSMSSKIKSLSELSSNSFMLLNKNATYKFGSWQLDNSDNEYYLCFAVRVTERIDGEALKSILEVIAKTADEMENTLTNKDDF